MQFDSYPGVIVIQVYFGKTAWCEPQDYLKKERQSSQPRGWEEEMGMKDPRKMGGQELYSRWEGGLFKALAKMRKVSENLRTTGPAKGIQSAVPPLTYSWATIGHSVLEELEDKGGQEHMTSSTGEQECDKHVRTLCSHSACFPESRGLPRARPRLLQSYQVRSNILCHLSCGRKSLTRTCLEM